MLMQLFDSDDRTHHGPAGHVEGTYSFLCRSAWEASAQARALLEDWFHHYPEAEQPELRRRFESDFDAAFFELAVHELLRRLGAVVEVHPEMPDVSTRPDYLAEFPGTTGVFVEVVVATDEPATEAAEKARQGQLWEEINKVPSPNFFLQISTYEVLTNRQPSGRRIRSFLERELKKYDADQVTDDYELAGSRALPTLRYEDPQVHIDFTLIPKKPVGRKKRSRPIGVYPMASRWGGTTPSIRNAISRKATRYGRLDRPFVVALNCASPWEYCQVKLILAPLGASPGQKTPLYWGFLSSGARASRPFRVNLTVPMRRFTRLTNGFSKKIENLRAAVALHFAWYNFVRVHQTLGVTPAMETGVTGRLWELGDLLAYERPYGAAV